MEESFPAVSTVMNRIGRERGWPPMKHDDYLQEANLHGANFIGSPREVVEKILFQREIFGHDRFMPQISVGPIPHAQVMHAVDLFGTKVAPEVRTALAPVPAGP